MSICDWFEVEWFWEKFLEQGVVVFFDVELLVIFLCMGVIGCSVVELLWWLLSEFGGLCVLFEVDFVLFCGYFGFGVVKYV